MNINDFIDELIIELAYRLDSGIPDLKNKQHLSVLSEILIEWGMGELETPLILTLLGEDEEKEFKNPDLNKVIPYTNVNGEKAEGKVGNLLRRPEKEDAHIQALAALGGKDSDRYKSAMDDLGAEGQPNRDIEGEREDGEEEGGEVGGEEPQTGTALKDPAYQKQLDKERETQKKLDAEKSGKEPKSTSDSPQNKPNQTKTPKTTFDINTFNKLSKKEQNEFLEREFSKKGEITTGLISVESTPLADGTNVRPIIDEDGNSIMTNTPEGRKSALRLINKRLDEMQDKIKLACNNFSGNTRVQKWLGEVGELVSLRDFLEADTEVYLLTDSSPESDMVVVDRNDKERDLKIVEISVKSTIGDTATGQKGANARAIFQKQFENKTIQLEGVGSVPADTAMDVVYDIRELGGRLISENLIAKENNKNVIKLSDDMLTSKFSEEYQKNYKENSVVGGKPTQENQTYFERGRLLDSTDVEELKNKMIDRANGDDVKIKIINYYISQLNSEVEKAGGKLPFNQVVDFMNTHIGNTADKTNPPTDAVIESDLISVHFDAETGKAVSKIASASDVHECQKSEIQQEGVPDECFDGNGRMLFKCQMKYYMNIFNIPQARGTYLQFKTNWRPPVKCVSKVKKSVSDYLKT
jgi:hypothetical protein